MNFENKNKSYNSKSSQAFIWMIDCASIVGCFPECVNALPLAVLFNIIALSSN